jgi:hypothetical protein
LMILSKENVLEFCMDTGIRVGQRKYQTLQNIPNVREIVPTSVFLLRRNFYLYARLQNFLRQRVSISTLQNRNHSRKLCEHIRESTRTLNMTVLEIFHLYAHQNFSSVCKTAKYRKTRRILSKHYESHKHSRIRAKTYPKSVRTINYTIVEIPLHVRLLEGSK